MSILLSIFNEQDESSLPQSAAWPSLMEFKWGRSIHSFILIIYILDIIVDKDQRNAKPPNSIEFKYGRSIH